MAEAKHIEVIKQSVDFIEQNLTNSISVRDICEAVSNSTWEFQRLFRLYTGDSIGDYLRTRRLSMAARELIENPGQRILDIAVKYQFGSQEAFTRAFKRVYSLTPGEARVSPSKVRLTQKLPLTTAQLNHNLSDIQRTPSIVVIPAKLYVGREIEIESPFAESTQFVNAVADLWSKFNPIRKEIKGRIRGTGYGLVLSPGGNMTEDKFPYVAAVEVTSAADANQIPEGLKNFKTESQLYAVFEKRGLTDKTKMSLDYIYGYWLPQSGYVRTMGFDIGVYDHRVRLDRPESISSYCIPIAKA